MQEQLDQLVAGKVRPSHRLSEKPARTWRTMEDLFDKDGFTILA
jgi:hypothetical protein